MSEKIKVFSCSVSKIEFQEILENQVNMWLRNNPGIRIISRQVSSSSGTNIQKEYYVNCTIVIFYENGS